MRKLTAGIRRLYITDSLTRAGCGNMVPGCMPALSLPLTGLLHPWEHHVELPGESGIKRIYYLQIALLQRLAEMRGEVRHTEVRSGEL